MASLTPLGGTSSVSLKAQAGESRVYAYYEPEKKGRAAATLLDVAE